MVATTVTTGMTGRTVTDPRGVTGVAPPDINTNKAASGMKACAKKLRSTHPEAKTDWRKRC